MKRNKKVLVVGSAEESRGGISSVIKLIKKMPVWDEYSCYWLGTQIQRNYLWKLWYALKSNFMAFFIIWKYDIIHFHTVPDKICLIIQMPTFLLSVMTKKKIVFHIHMGNQLENETGNGLFKWCLTKSDLVILLANRWKKLFEEKFKMQKGLEHIRTAVLYNACDPVPEVPYVDREKSIIWVGYMDDNKAPDILLKAWKQILEEENMDEENNTFKYSDWSVTLMGNGHVGKFQNLADKLGLHDKVTFTGYIVGQQKDDYFRNASIHVLSSYHEGFPMVVLESWAYGIPVISTPVGGLPDVIEENKNCVTFKFGDPDDLAEKIKMLIRDAELRKEMSSFEREFVVRNFSIDAIGHDLRNIYESL